MTVTRLLADLARRGIRVEVMPDGRHLEVVAPKHVPWYEDDFDALRARKPLVITYLRRLANGTLPRLVVSRPRRPAPGSPAAPASAPQEGRG